MKLRNYQRNGVAEAVNSFKDDNRFRLNMVTASGKTIMAIEIAKKIAKGKRVIISVHTNQLRSQFEKEVGNKLDDYMVTTHQSLVGLDESCYMLIVDEVHQGGQTKLGNYKKIIDSLEPEKILSLSATDYKVDEKLFGNKKFIYGLEQAISIINPCDLITIDTGLFQKLSNDDLIREEKLSELKNIDRKKGVDLKFYKSIESILKGSIRSAISVYRKRERGSQALFFVPTIELAEWASDHFHGVSARVTHSNLKRNSNIIDFKNKDFDVLIAVRQMQEGFDYTDLEVVFDCAPSFTNDGRIFKQRLGRCLRKRKGKAKSRYYIINRVNKYTNYIDIHDSTRAVIQESIVNDLMDKKKDSTKVFIPRGVVEDNICVSKLFITEANSSREVNSECLFDMINCRSRDLAGRKSKLLCMAKNKDDRPTEKTNASLWRSLIMYTSTTNKMYDVDFTENLKKINPYWTDRLRSCESSSIRKDEILEVARNGGFLKARSKVMGSFHNYMRKGSKTFDQSFSDEMKRLRPDWFERSTAVGRRIRSEIIALALSGSESPKCTDKGGLYYYIYRRTNENSGRYDKEFHKKLKKIAPKEWKIK